MFKSDVDSLFDLCQPFSLQTTTDLILMQTYLLNVSIANLLVQNHAHRTLGHIVHHTRLAMVDLVHHTLLLGAIILDVHDVANFVAFHVC